MAKPSIRELLDELRVDEKSIRLIVRVERVLALHKSTSAIQMIGTGMTGPSCVACFPAPWPCPTVRALEGEE